MLFFHPKKLPMATTSHLLHHLPSPRPPPWPSLFHYSLSLQQTSISFTSPLFCSHLFAVHSRKFDFNDLKFDPFGNDDDDDRTKRRKRSSRRTRKNDKKSYKKQKQWWSINIDDEDSLPQKSRPGILNQVIHNVWIFKVLASYGWFSPFIIISLLIATGPKAFLMAFSFPLGLSLVILAFQKLQEWLDESRKPRRRRKKRSPFSYTNGPLMEVEEEEEEEEEEDNDEYIRKEVQQKRGSRKWDYRSKGSSSSSANGSSFGGWDDLVTEEETRGARSSSEMNIREASKEEVKLNSEMNNREASKENVKLNSEMSIREASKEEVKLNRSLEDRELPLLLRFLVALFPFLESWTSLL